MDVRSAWKGEPASYAGPALSPNSTGQVGIFAVHPYFDGSAMQSLLDHCAASGRFVWTSSQPPTAAPWPETLVTLTGCPALPRRIVVRSDGALLRIETFTARQSFTRMQDGGVDDTLQAIWAVGFRQTLVQTPEGDLQALRSARQPERTTLRRCAPSRTTWAEPTADRRKRRLLDPQHDAAILHALDLATADGTIRTTMADKYRQLERLLETALHLDAVTTEADVTIVDAGCGKAYLSLALAALLERDGRTVHLRGVDTNAFVIDHARRTAEALGLRDALFTVGPIAAIAEEACTCFLALHACDTASDDAIVAALRCRAEAILIAPCCHHHVQRQLRAATAPAWARPLLEDGITKERLGDLVTDTIRRDVVRAHGYNAHLEEFVALEHTAKNILLKAERHRTTPATADLSAVAATAAAWGVEPYLLTALTER